MEGSYGFRKEDLGKKLNSRIKDTTTAKEQL